MQSASGEKGCGHDGRQSPSGGRTTNTTDGRLRGGNASHFAVATRYGLAGWMVPCQHGGDIAGERCSANTGNGAVEGIWEMGWGWMGPICGMGGSFEGNTMYGGDPSRRTHRGGWVGVGVRLYAWDRYLIALLRLVGHSLRPQGCNVEHIQGLRRTQRHKAAVQ